METLAHWIGNLSLALLVVAGLMLAKKAVIYTVADKRLEARRREKNLRRTNQAMTKIVNALNGKGVFCDKPKRDYFSAFEKEKVSIKLRSI